MLIRPQEPILETSVKIVIQNSTIYAEFEYNDEFKELVKSLHYIWDGSCWNRKITRLSGPLLDRAGELCHKLVSNGFCVKCSEEIYNKASCYLPEKKKWILTKDKHFRIFWRRGLDYYSNAQSITGSFYDKNSKCVLVPQEYFEEVKDFSEIHGFNISPEAQSLFFEAKRIKASATVVDWNDNVDNDISISRPTLKADRINIPTEFIDYSGFDFDTKTILLPHQIPAINKMSKLTIGALFMDMGTGKTRCAIELCHTRRHKCNKIVYFCPVSLKETVEEEFLKHATLIPYVFDDTTSTSDIPNKELYIVGIESVSGSDRVALAVNSIVDKNTFVIVDESGYIKGHNAKRTKRITNICQDCRYKLVMTGTPITQGIVDLYAQMKFLSPRILGYNSFYSFAHNHLEYSEKYPGMIVKSHNVPYITSKIEPYVYQVTKEECLDLPKKLYDIRYFSMTEEQSVLYRSAKEQILLESPVDEMDSVIIFRLYNALQQISSGFWNCGELEEVEHERIDMLLSIIDSIPKNEKIIIWTKYVYSLDKIYESLYNKFGDVSVLHGSLNEKERSRQLKLFRKENRFLIATQATGSHGLNLTECRFVIFYENEFKYSTRIQAEDRCHRIGQTKPVTYIDIVCRNGIDKRIQEALSKKRNVAENIREEIKRCQSI